MSATVLRFLLFFLASLLAAGCTDSNRELGMASELDMKMWNVCVGRYTMDVPAKLKRQQHGVDGGGDATFYFGHDEDFTKVDLTVVDAKGKEAFESAVLAREIQLGQQQNFSTEGSMLISRESISPEVELISSYASVDSTDAIRIEAHTLLNNSHVVLGETAYSSDTKGGIQSRLISMLSSLTASSEAASPSPGFCIGSVVFHPGSDYEEAELTYAGSLDGVPVKLRVDINTFEHALDEPTLIMRGEANLEGLGVSPEKLRAGPRSVAGDTGEEWLGAFVEDGRRLHGFYAETGTRKPTRESPKILVSFLTGDDEAGSSRTEMDDGLAIALWDRILASIKKRPD